MFDRTATLKETKVIIIVLTIINRTILEYEFVALLVSGHIWFCQLTSHRMMCHFTLHAKCTEYSFWKIQSYAKNKLVFGRYAIMEKIANLNFQRYKLLRCAPNREFIDEQDNNLKNVMKRI